MAFSNIDLNNPTLEARFWAKVRMGTPDECWIWTAAKNAGGYGVIGVSKDRTALATHVALALAGFPRPDGANACHRCDNRPCVNPAHLWWGDIAENNQDMHRKGRWWREEPKGEKNWAHKLTEAQVREIRSLAEPNTVTAKRFGVTATLIWKIRHRHLWAHLD